MGNKEKIFGGLHQKTLKFKTINEFKRRPVKYLEEKSTEDKQIKTMKLKKRKYTGETGESYMFALFLFSPMA